MAIGDPLNWAALGTPHNPLAQVGISHVENHMRAQEAQARSDKWRNETFASLVTPPSPTLTPSEILAKRGRELFLKRMGGIKCEMQVSSGDFVACHVYGETVYLFYCFGGREGVVREEASLFPSDQLITQFRMILA